VSARTISGDLDISPGGGVGRRPVPWLLVPGPVAGAERLRAGRGCLLLEALMNWIEIQRGNSIGDTQIDATLKGLLAPVTVRLWWPHQTRVIYVSISIAREGTPRMAKPDMGHIPNAGHTQTRPRVHGHVYPWPCVCILVPSLHCDTETDPSMASCASNNGPG
jgi:hypothetical protein